MTPWIHEDIENIGHEYRCSNCGYIAMRYSHMIYSFRGEKSFSTPEYNYCPNCGKGMREEEMSVVIQNGVYICNGEIIINGIKLPPPPTRCRNITTINGKVYIDGYEFKNGKWKKTLRAWWHLWF